MSASIGAGPRHTDSCPQQKTPGPPPREPGAPLRCKNCAQKDCCGAAELKWVIPPFAHRRTCQIARGKRKRSSREPRQGEMLFVALRFFAPLPAPSVSFVGIRLSRSPPVAEATCLFWERREKSVHVSKSLVREKKRRRKRTLLVGRMLHDKPRSRDSLGEASKRFLFLELLASRFSLLLPSAP